MQYIRDFSILVHVYTRSFSQPCDISYFLAFVGDAKLCYHLYVPGSHLFSPSNSVLSRAVPLRTRHVACEK
jgi:hypothetical protein